MAKLVSVTLEYQMFAVRLSLKRAPRYLRFVVRGSERCSRNWDALDQPHDQPELGERVIAALKSSSGSMHLDRTVNGRRVGEWYETAIYWPVEEQPPEDVLRDNQNWQEWCLAQQQKSSAESETA